MTKKNKILLIAGIVVLVAAVAVLLGLLLPSCGEDTPAAEPSGNMTYTVEIKNANELPLADIGVYIYEDETLAELVWYDTTDENGLPYFGYMINRERAYRYMETTLEGMQQGIFEYLCHPDLFKEKEPVPVGFSLSILYPFKLFNTSAKFLIFDMECS